MGRRGVLVAAIVIGIAGYFAYSFRRTTDQISPDELARRVAASRPEWENYMEDLKAQVGVRELAEWEGEPVRAVREGHELRIEFRVSGPWAARDVAMPILIRDPFGNLRRNLADAREDDAVTYRFNLPDIGPDAPLPWVEIQYPNRQRRIVFTEGGVWPEGAESR